MRTTLRQQYYIKLFLTLLAFCSMVIPVDWSLAQGGAVLVRAVPANAQVVLNQSVDIAVEVVDVSAMYGFDIRMSFDPQVLEVVDANSSQSGIQVAMGDFLDPGFMIINQVDNQAGELQVVMTQMNPSESKSGSGNLIVVKFKGKQVNQTRPVTLVDVQLAQRDGTILGTTLQSGNISVVSSLSGPTNTPVPTQNPGTLVPTLDPTDPPKLTPSSTPTNRGIFNPTATSPSGNPTATRTLAPNPTSTGRSSIVGAPTTTPTPTGSNLLLTTTPQLTYAADPTDQGGSPSQITPINAGPTGIAQAQSTPLLGSGMQTPTVLVTVLTETEIIREPGTPWLSSSSAICIGAAGILLGFLAALAVLRKRPNQSEKT